MITHVIAAGLQVMALNERSRKGCSQKSEPEGSSCFLGLKGAERAERKTGWLCQNGREIWREIMCEKLFFGAVEFCAKFGAKLARKIWAYDLQYRKISHQFPACLVPKISRPFLNLLSWFFSPAHPGLSYHRLFPFFMGRNKASQRIGARSATKLEHNLR